LIRYRTGDLVRAARPPAGHPRPSPLWLTGGILGRVDDMVVVRGVNIYPSAVEQIVRGLDGIGEYRVTLDTGGAMAELAIEAETTAAVADELARRLHQSLALRVPVAAVADGSLPRSELKARRWIRR
jgi:phenylacetate-CoA ligase